MLKKTWRNNRDAQRQEKKTIRNKTKCGQSNLQSKRYRVGAATSITERLVADNACHLFFAAYFHTLI